MREDFRCTGLGIRMHHFSSLLSGVPEGCLSTFYTIYSVFPLRKNLTYLLGFCLFILKDEVLAAAFPFIYLIMYIFVKPSFLCICTHE